MGTLAGFLLAALTIVTGRLTDAAGHPVGGARIDLLPQSVGWPGEPRKAGVSAPDGTFRFEPPVARDESPGWFHLRAESDCGVAITGAFPLGEGEVPLGDVTLLPAVVLRVEIRDWTGRPVSRVPVLAEVRGLRVGDGIDSPFALPLAAKTDGGGTASFSPLPADPGLRVVLRVDVQGNPVLEQEFTLPPSRNPVRITLGRGRTVRGRVLLPTGEPAANHNVEVGSRGALTDAGGGFSLGDLPCGTTVLFVETG
ncbi:MAG: carboxypeptidase-like regulatory domain-containing protein, partial [Planctomycetes bacterium]|nr:carboxypeptidase-like regulatory domain-containing protein [Planctomycetota bacterium]